MALTDPQRINFEVVVKGLFATGGGSKPKPTANVFHYKRTAFVFEYDGAAFLAAWLTANKAAWKALVNLAWTFDKITIRCIDDPVEGFTESIVNEAGSVTGDCLPNYSATVFTKITGLRGKSYRGRFYVAGIGEDDNANNSLTAGAKTRADTLATAIKATLTDANGTTYKFAVMSPTLWNLVAVPPIPFLTVCTDVKARKQIGRMGSRAAPVIS